jgi:hypothetical protein
MSGTSFTSLVQPNDEVRLSIFTPNFCWVAAAQESAVRHGAEEHIPSAQQGFTPQQQQLSVRAKVALGCSRPAYISISLTR